MLNPKAGRQYWFVKPETVVVGADPATAQITPFIRHSDGSAGVESTIYENHPDAWKRALEEIYRRGYCELEEARAAGLVPPDWDIAPSVRALRPHEEPEVLHERMLANNRACQRLNAAAPLCPRCGSGSEGIRFIDRIPEMEQLRIEGFLYTAPSYFICNACTRSFGLDGRMDAVRTVRPVEDE